MPEAAETETVEETTETEPTATVEQLQAEVDKWKTQSRKNEDRAKANAKAQKELDDLRTQSMTEQERAVEAARAEARAETMREVGEARVGDAFRVAVAGRDVDVDELIEGVNLAKFLGDDGTPDGEAVKRWVDKIAPVATTDPAPIDLGQGARSGGSGPKDLESELRAQLGV